MGYHTFYNFCTERPSTKVNLEYFIEEFRKTCEDAKHAFTDEGLSEQDCTWYEHEADCKEFSKQYPDTVFLLTGTGEETFDVWKKYFKNGKMQHCPVVTHFDKYDESKLE